MLEIYFKEPGEAPFQKIEKPKKGSWIYLRESVLDDLSRISEITQIDLTDLKDSLDKYELPRVEHLKENVLFFVRHPSDREPGLYTETLTLLLTPDYVIAISPSRSEIIEHLITSNTPLRIEDRAKLFLYILLKITQDYTNSIKRLRHSTIGYEMAHEVVDSDAIFVLTKNEEILNQFLTSLVPMRHLLETLASGRFMNLYEKDLDLLQDLMIAIKQSEDVCSVNIKSIRSLRDSYHIIFTNDVNRTIKLLTALTILFSIPTIIASLYGMNVALPFQSNPFAFFFIIGVTAVSSFLVFFWFQKRRWL